MNERMQAARSEDTLEIATPADVTAIRGDRRRLAVVPQDIFLSTAAPRRWDWRLAVAVVLVSVVGLTVAAPYASYRWPVTSSFIAAYEAAMLVSDLITAILLIGQFRQVRRVGVLIVGCGYLFSAVIVTVHALSFPEVFSATGLLGTSRQATVWLYVMWHGIFPVFVCAYALVHGSRWNEPLAPHRVGPAIMIGAAVAVGVAAVCTLLATWGIDLLPELIRGNDYKRVVTSGIAPAAWSISLVALVLLWVRTRGRSVLDLWLMVVMVAWLLDIFLSTLISTVRYDFGWYAGRIYGRMAHSFVLGALLLEANLLYGCLACSLTDAREKNAALEKQTPNWPACMRMPSATSSSESDTRARCTKRISSSRPRLASWMRFPTLYLMICVRPCVRSTGLASFSSSNTGQSCRKNRANTCSSWGTTPCRWGI